MKLKKLLIVSLLSLSLIAMELIWTRIFSAEFFYTFAFLIISISILGLGLGGLLLRLFKPLRKPHLLGIYLTLTAVLGVASPIAIFNTGLDFNQVFNSWSMLWNLIANVFILASGFITGGMSLSLIFREDSEIMDKLYMADLIGAGSGVLVAVLLMNYVGTPAAVAFIALPVLIAASLAYPKHGILRTLAFLFAILSLSPYMDDYLQLDREERAEVEFTHWDAMAKLKVYSYSDDYKGINIDNVANSPMIGFDGNWDRPDSAKFNFGIDVKYLIDKYDDCTFLSLGAGGGNDVLQALQYGAKEIHAVEVNPYINYLLTEGKYAEFTGNIYNDSRVKVVSEDARSYIRRFENKFDVIYSLSSNTWAALSSGAFALAENYIFTKEAFQDYWYALSEDGIMMMEHQLYMPRLLSACKEALESDNIDNPEKHIAVIDLPAMRRKALILSKKEISSSILENAFYPEMLQYPQHFRLLFPISDSTQTNIYNQIMQFGWESVADSAKIDISPSYDDRPFVAQLGLMKNFTWEQLGKKLNTYDLLLQPLSKLIMLILIGVVILIMIPINLLPYLKYKKVFPFSAWMYYFMIGMGFMGVEAILIQKYSLFLGASVYSVATILLSLLLSSGIGAAYSDRFEFKHVFMAIVGLIILDALVYSKLIYLLNDISLPLRIIFTVIFMAPLGFFMGMPFPKISKKVGNFVDWGFSVNGAASMLGSTLIVLISFELGFNISLLIASLFYVIAYLFTNRYK